MHRSHNRCSWLGMLVIGFVIGNSSLLSQTTSTELIRIGDVARKLSDQDISDLEAAVALRGKPWLLLGERGQRPLAQFIEAYLSPDNTTGRVRRGRIVRVSRLAPSSAWTIDNNNYQQGFPRGGSYAQVAVSGRSFDQIQGDEDLNRPFLVEGNISDADLVSIVTFIRSTQLSGGRTTNTGPIQSVSGNSPTSAIVWIRAGAMASEILTLNRQVQGWVIVQVLFGQA
jgi:hypothetical protein